MKIFVKLWRSFQRLKRSLEPTDDWGPADAEHRKNYKYAKQPTTAKLIAGGDFIKQNDATVIQYDNQNEKVQLYN